ncbi:MAG: carbohydrate ABC transporter substrate-binding protein [Clostridia bacterium]|nr:carbohydrate ABC transporter substrate-binding protein [Clostridia bacterium]
MKKLIAMLLALALVLGMAPAALASEGDVTLFHADNNEGRGYDSVENCMLLNGRVYYTVGYELCVYDIVTKTTETYDASEIVESAAMESEADDEYDDEGNYIDIYRETAAWFMHGDDIYAVVNIRAYSDSGSTLDGGYVYRLELADGKAQLVESDLPRLNWSSMTEDYGNYVYSRWAQNSFASGDSLYIQTYDDDGNNVLEVFDLTTGQNSERYIQDLYEMVPAGDGRLIVMQYNWSEETAHFAFYDPASESLEPAADYPIDQTNYNLPNGVCYRAENDTLYYVLSGEIWAAQGFDFGGAVSVNDSPVSGGNGITQMTDDGFLLLWDWQTVVLRNTDPAKRSEITLYVKDYVYIDALDNAYYDYTNAHGDVSVVISRNGSRSDILQAMMNRDSSVDIYCMDMSASEYNAVFNRGYMAELDSSAKLTEKIDSMYPAISEALKKDGHLYAVPANAYGYTIGVQLEALEKLGMTLDDLPGTWDEFFDFLAELPAKLEGKDVRAFESWYDQRDLRYQLFGSLLESYQNYINAGEAEYAFNTPLLKGLIDRIETIDYEALGVIEMSYDEETDTWYDNYDDRTPLFVSSVSVTVQGYSAGETLLLSFGDEAPRASFYLRVAFVNPFSKHVPEAIEMLEVMLDDINQSSQYTFYPDMNEPIHYPDYEEYKVNLAQWLEEAKKARDEMDEEYQADYDEYIAYLENEIANIEDTYWMFSPQEIEAYERRVPYLSPVTYDFTNEISGEDENFYDLIQRYYDGQIGVEELLAAIDKKVQMMRMEDM